MIASCACAAAFSTMKLMEHYLADLASNTHRKARGNPIVDRRSLLQKLPLDAFQAEELQQVHTLWQQPSR